MNACTALEQQQLACRAIEDQGYDLQAKLFALQDLHCLASQRPDDIVDASLMTIKRLLLSKQLNRMRQRLFLFREATGILAELFSRAHPNGIGRHAWQILLAILADGHDYAHRAAAEALGKLPAGIPKPTLSEKPLLTMPSLTWNQLISEAGFRPDSAIHTRGRTLVVSQSGRGQVLAVKFARVPGDEIRLQAEANWMDHLLKTSLDIPLRFDVPQPMAHAGQWVVRVTRPPGKKNKTKTRPAIAFYAPEDYFRYPNPFDPGLLPKPIHFEEIIGRNAFLLGRLTACGMAHTAPIPLFHNRVQQERRRDGGLYEWPRGGRLDRWLASCAYPNFGYSGLRDFEHFTAIERSGGDLSVYRLIGQQLLSLLLVVGSYFRAQDPGRIGSDAQGQPVDARDLFDATCLKSWIDVVFKKYYLGFVGETLPGDGPVDRHRLAARMIEEMGVDRHMEEILRVPDQENMTGSEFEHFLTERGYAPHDIRNITKGQKELIIQSGPHLGAFNRTISLPELIEAVAAVAAVCMAGRYRCCYLKG